MSYGERREFAAGALRTKSFENEMAAYLPTEEDAANPEKVQGFNGCSPVLKLRTKCSKTTAELLYVLLRRSEGRNKGTKPRDDIRRYREAAGS